MNHLRITYDYLLKRGRKDNELSGESNLSAFLFAYVRKK